MSAKSHDDSAPLERTIRRQNLAKPRDLAAPQKNTVHLARFGTVALVIPDGVPKSEAVDALKSALNDDSRVAEIAKFESNLEWTNILHIATRRPFNLPEIERLKIISGKHLSHVLRLSSAAIFKVSIPIKNQRSFKGYNDIPSADYWVAWNGLTLVVSWEHQAGANAPRSGGHSVVDVLKDVAESAGYGIYVQPCSPQCINIFAHQLLWASPCKEEGGRAHLKVRHKGHIDVSIHGPSIAASPVEGIARAIIPDADVFAQYKNLSRQIRDIETIGRRMVDELLGLNLSFLYIRRLKFFRRIQYARKASLDRKRSRELVALLWICLARQEAIRRNWEHERRRLLEGTEYRKTECLFDRDRTSDDASISSLDLGLVRASAEQFAARQDSRTLATITSVGITAASLGALLGAIVTALAK